MPRFQPGLELELTQDGFARVRRRFGIRLSMPEESSDVEGYYPCMRSQFIRLAARIRNR